MYPNGFIESSVLPDSINDLDTIQLLAQWREDTLVLPFQIP